MTLRIQAQGFTGYVVTHDGVTHRVLWDEQQPSCDCGTPGCVGLRLATRRRAEDAAVAHPPQPPRVTGRG